MSQRKDWLVGDVLTELWVCESTGLDLASARILRVQVNSRLSWNTQASKLQKKAVSQVAALKRLTTST